MNKDEVIAILKKQNQQLMFQLDKMQAQLDKLLRQLYGRKSEQVPKNKSLSQNDAVNNNNKILNKNNIDNNSNNKPKRQKLPKNFIRKSIIHDLPEAQKYCKKCNHKKQRIGQDITEQLDYIPAKLFVKEHIKYKYKCDCCIETAAMPAQPIDKGIPGSGLLADILISKYSDSMPLYRQMLRFKRDNINISDSTLCDWVAKSAFLLEPIVKAMQSEVLRSLKIHTDDTPVPVLSKNKTINGRLWVYIADGANTNKATVYDYTANRSKNGPIKFLGDYQGYLQADAYAGYDALYNNKNGKITEVACMAHARRKFYDVAVAAKGKSIAHDALDKIADLYKIEFKCKGLSAAERYRYRKKYSKPILKILYKWLKTQSKKLVPNTPIMKAVQYSLNHWRALSNFLSSGYLDIDNNKAERAMRIVAIGRKNWLFAGSHEGGKRAAIIYSVLETCKQNNVNPFEYLSDVLAKIPNTKQSNIKSLLPYFWNPS